MKQKFTRISLSHQCFPSACLNLSRNEAPVRILSGTSPGETIIELHRGDRRTVILEREDLVFAEDELVLVVLEKNSGL